MIDKEKIIKEFELFIKEFHPACTSEGIELDMFKEVLALLKKQEAKPMTEYDDGWDCPRCGLKLIGKTASGYPCDVLDLPNDEIVKYCPVCGQAVKWND